MSSDFYPTDWFSSTTDLASSGAELLWRSTSTGVFPPNEVLGDVLPLDGCGQPATQDCVSPSHYSTASDDSATDPVCSPPLSPPIGHPSELEFGLSGTPGNLDFVDTATLQGPGHVGELISAENDYFHCDPDFHRSDDSTDQYAEEDADEMEEDDESSQYSREDSFSVKQDPASFVASSFASQDIPSPSPMSKRSNYVTPTQANQTQGKKRGRPRTKPLPPVVPATASRKRKAEIPAEQLHSTSKKSKLNNDGKLVLTGRLPSSLTDEELQTLSSQEYETYLNSIYSTLTKNELETAKKQKRRIKNRESAWNSRLRKQGNLEELEAQVRALKDENNSLKAAVETMATENRIYTQQLEETRELARKYVPENLWAQIERGPSSSQSWSARNTLSRTSDFEEVSTKTARRLGGRDYRSSAALCCLLLFAVAFGTVMQNSGNSILSNRLLVPGSALKAAQLPFDEPSIIPLAPMTPVSSLSSSPLGDREWLVRMLANPENNAETDKIAPAPLTTQATLVEPKLKSNPARQVVSVNVPSRNETVPRIEEQPLASSSSSASTSSASSSSSTQAPPAFTPEWKQNTTYLMCGDLKQVIPPADSQPPVDPDSPLFVSLWLQPAAIGLSSIGSASKDPLNSDYMVQVTCQILSVEQLGLLTKSLSLNSASSKSTTAS